MLIWAPGWWEGFAIWDWGIWDLSRKIRGFRVAGTGLCTGGWHWGVFCKAREEVGFSHNSPRWWRGGVAKAGRGKRKADEETREIRARA